MHSTMQNQHPSERTILGCISGLQQPHAEGGQIFRDILDPGRVRLTRGSSLKLWCGIFKFTKILSLQLWAHLWCNPGWTMPTPLYMECQLLTHTNYSLPKIILLVWFCLLFAICQQVSDLVTSTGFLFTTEYSSKSLHLPIRP